MRDLEQRITDWREQMLAARISPDALEELESHLRDEISRQMKSGATAPSAFDHASKQIGPVNKIKNEFKKTESNPMKKTIIICAGVVGVLVGMAFVLPAVAQYKRLGLLKLDEMILLPLGVALTVGGIIVAIRARKMRRA